MGFGRTCGNENTIVDDNVCDNVDDNVDQNDHYDQDMDTFSFCHFPLSPKKLLRIS